MGLIINYLILVLQIIMWSRLSFILTEKTKHSMDQFDLLIINFYKKTPNKKMDFPFVMGGGISYLCGASTNKQIRYLL